MNMEKLEQQQSMCFCYNWEYICTDVKGRVVKILSIPHLQSQELLKILESSENIFKMQILGPHFWALEG